MEKNKNLILLIALIVIALLFKYSGFLGSLFEPLDDYAIYDDFSEGVVDNNKYSFEFWGSGYPLPYIQNGELITKSSIYTPVGGSAGSVVTGYKTTKITIDKDIKGIDFKFDLGFSGKADGDSANLCPGYRILLNNVTVYTYNWVCLSANGVLSKDMFTFETKSHLLDKNLVDVYVKGKYVNTFNITDDEIKISINPYFSSKYYAYLYSYLDNIKSRTQFNCEIFDDEMLVTEVYASGETIYREDDGRLISDGCKHLKFCRRHPAFIITSEGSTSDEGDEIYETITRGGNLTVPAGETWQLFFITKKTSTGRCEGYVPITFEPVPINTNSALTQTIYPGKFKTFETDPINILDMPSILQATFEIKAVSGGVEQVKKEIIVFKK